MKPYKCVVCSEETYNMFALCSPTCARVGSLAIHLHSYLGEEERKRVHAEHKRLYTQAAYERLHRKATRALHGR